MQFRAILCSIVIMSFGLAGCIGNDSESSGPCDDGTVDILTYDILALSEDMVNQFTIESGYCVNFIYEDDAGSILDKMMLTKNSPVADLMIGLDNTYLQTALANDLLEETNYVNNAGYQNITESALEPYSGTMAVPFDMGPVCLNYDERFVDDENVSTPTSLWLSLIHI